MVDVPNQISVHAVYDVSNYLCMTYVSYVRLFCIGKKLLQCDKRRMKPRQPVVASGQIMSPPNCRQVSRHMLRVNCIPLGDTVSTRVLLLLPAIIIIIIEITTIISLISIIVVAECRVFDGLVLEVLTGDTIVVAESTGSGDDYEERKVSFSSIR